MRILRALKLILTLRCEESIRILSESRDSQVTWVERWAYRLHLIGCVPCRRFRRQIAFLRKASNRRGCEGHAHAAGEKLSASARTRILKAIRAMES